MVLSKQWLIICIGGMKLKLSNLGMKKIKLAEVDEIYSGQNILMKLGELYQFESGIYGLNLKE